MQNCSFLVLFAYRFLACSTMLLPRLKSCFNWDTGVENWGESKGPGEIMCTTSSNSNSNWLRRFTISSFSLQAALWMVYLSNSPPGNLFRSLLDIREKTPDIYYDLRNLREAFLWRYYLTLCKWRRHTISFPSLLGLTIYSDQTKFKDDFNTVWTTYLRKNLPT